MLGRCCVGLFAVALQLHSPKSSPAPSERNTIRNRIASPTETVVPNGRNSVRSPIAPQPRFRRRVLFAPDTFGFPQLNRAAGIIFSGTVTHIERIPARAGQALETIAIRFHVEYAIRGVTPGDSVTISEWIGLWSAGQRYQLGERLLLFLYPPSKLGLTSCVGGSLGRFAVDPAGHISLSGEQVSAFQGNPVFGGRSRVRLSDFAWAVRAREEE